MKIFGDEAINASLDSFYEAANSRADIKGLPLREDIKGLSLMEKLAAVRAVAPKSITFVVSEIEEFCIFRWDRRTKCWEKFEHHRTLSYEEAEERAKAFSVINAGTYTVMEKDAVSTGTVYTRGKADFFSTFQN